MTRHKYNAKATVVDGIRFDSKKESLRYSELKLLERTGVITDLKLQPRFDIEINGVDCGFYKADFWYREDGKAVVEDVKGYRKGAAYAMFKFKKKIVEAIYNCIINEV